MRKSDLSKVNEGLADLAQKAEMDHEVQMARSDLYKIAKYAIKLHEMLKGVSEQQGLEGWVQAKITKSADYISSVYHHLDYDTKFENTVHEEVEQDYSNQIAQKLEQKLSSVKGQKASQT